MTTIRAPLSTILDTVRSDLEKEAREAAGSNTLISKSEQANLKDSITRDAADALRAAGGPGSTVDVDSLVESASAMMATLLGTVNQTSGPGAATVSQSEVKALVAANPDAGVRVARAYELITGKRIELGGVEAVDAPPPIPQDSLGELNAIHQTAFFLVEQKLDSFAGGNGALNASERAAIEPAFLRDAANATPPPRTVNNVTVRLFADHFDPLLARLGVDMVNLGVLNAPGTALLEIPFPRDVLVRLVDENPGAAGLFADAIATVSGTRPDVPGLPAARFIATSSAPPPPPSAPTVLQGVPGAVGAVTLIDPAKIDALLIDLERLVPMADMSRDGKVTLSEMVSFCKRASAGTFPDNPVNLDPFLYALYGAREKVWMRTRTSPSPAAILEELKVAAARARELGTDENNSAFDAHGPVDMAAERVAVALFDRARAGALDFDAEPWVRFFDHEGDVAPTKRVPLDLVGPPEQVIRRLVFHHNRAGNDNHWPLWSGRATSRYRLDATETDMIVNHLRALPLPLRQSLFQALVDWLSWPTDKPGLLYVEPGGRELLDYFANELGHPYRSPQGETTAPTMPAP